LNELLVSTAQSWGLTLSEQQIDQFAIYERELRAWNERLNLTAITDQRGITVRHFLDSLSCAVYWGKTPESLIDIGTGAGFPGLPLKILCPEMQLTLVESIEKKAGFLRFMAQELGLEQVEVCVERAERIGHNPDHRERYEISTARAVAELRALAEYCLPLCRVGGKFLAPKGGQTELEVQDARIAIGTLGGRIAQIEHVDLPDADQRTIVIIEKRSHTPKQYPRAVGVPTKRPIQGN
jgi:16S rRNA (guanine527-N7)-methyltransferase